jgi:hypothetical protein
MTASAQDFIVFFSNAQIHNPNWVLNKYPYYDSDYVFGYNFVPQLSTQTMNQVGNSLMSATSLSGFDNNVSSSVAIQNITTNVTCQNRHNATIFNASVFVPSYPYGSAYELFFYLTNLVDPYGCSLYYSYFSPVTRITYTWRYKFWEFIQAQNTAAWTKIAYSELIQDMYQDYESLENNEAPQNVEEVESLNVEGVEYGEDTPANKLLAQITDLALKYQIETDKTAWVTVDALNSNHPILDDSIKYLYAEPEEAVEETVEEYGEEMGEMLGNGETIVESETKIITTTTPPITTTTSSSSGGQGSNNGGTTGWTITITNNGKTTTYKQGGSNQGGNSP